MNATPAGRPPGPRCTSKTEREEHLANVAALDRKGYTGIAIARMLDRTAAQICYDLKKIRERYRKEQFGSREELVAEKMHQYKEVRTEAWEAWERSKNDREKHVTEVSTGAEGSQSIKERDEKEGRLPAAEYLRLYNETLEAERELLGIDPERTKSGEVNVNVGVQVNIWDALAGVVESPPLEQVIEQKLLETLDETTTPQPQQPPINIENSIEYGLKELIEAEEAK